MKLILKSLKQVEFDINISSAKITVKEFKKEIEKLYSFDSEQIKLIFNGTILENDKKLEDYEIKENNHIIIMNTKTKKIKNENKPKPIEYQEKPQQIRPEIGSKDKPNISQILSDNWDIQVNSLVDMGFERSQVEAAVKAANGRIDLAVEYLNNGIPDNKVNNNNNRNNNMQRQRNKDDITKELKKQAGVIKMLCKDNKLRIFEILNNIKYNDPGLMRLITDYRDDFKNYLDSPITEEDKQNYEKKEAEADKIQQERKEKMEKEIREKEEKEKREKEEKEKKEKEEKEKKEKEEKEKKEKEEKEKEKEDGKNEEKKEDNKDDNDKNKEENEKEEKNENENKMEEEKKESKENKELNIPEENMENKQDAKDDNQSNNIEPKKDDNMDIEEKDKNLVENNNDINQENSGKKDENEKKEEVVEEKKEEKKEINEDKKKEEKAIEIKENKDKAQETANSKIENSENNPLINQLTEEEKEAVNRIKSLCDFSFQTVLEAYIACNKNEELTANFLFENM